MRVTEIEPIPGVRMRLVEAELPPGVQALMFSEVSPDEIREDETPVQAMARLGRAVVLKD